MFRLSFSLSLSRSLYSKYSLLYLIMCRVKRAHHQMQTRTHTHSTHTLSQWVNILFGSTSILYHLFVIKLLKKINNNVLHPIFAFVPLALMNSVWFLCGWWCECVCELKKSVTPFVINCCKMHTFCSITQKTHGNWIAVKRCVGTKKIFGFSRRCRCAYVRECVWVLVQF